MCHNPAAKKITIKVIKAKSLIKADVVGSSDPYVKIELWHNGKGISKAKTKTKKDTVDPVFDKTVEFELPVVDKNTKVEFIVMDEDWGKDEFLGRIAIGGENCTDGTGLKHWNMAMAAPLDAIEVWHPLS